VCWTDLTVLHLLHEGKPFVQKVSVATFLIAKTVAVIWVMPLKIVLWCLRVVPHGPDFCLIIDTAEQSLIIRFIIFQMWLLGQYYRQHDGHHHIRLEHTLFPSTKKTLTSIYNRGSRFLNYNFLQFAIDGKNNSKTKVQKVFFFIFMSSYAEMRFLKHKITK
jgi:hypothetical protein